MEDITDEGAVSEEDSFEGGFDPNLHRRPGFHELSGYGDRDLVELEGEEDEETRMALQKEVAELVSSIMQNTEGVVDERMERLEELRVQLLSDPSDADGLAELTEILIDLGRQEDAERILFGGEKGSARGPGLLFHGDAIALFEKLQVSRGKILRDRIEECAAVSDFESIISNIEGNPDFFNAVFRSPDMLHMYAVALIQTGNEGRFLDHFSSKNRYFARSLTLPGIRQVLGFLHENRRYDLMLDVCTEVLKVNPGFENSDRFADFASRAYNAHGKFTDTLDLLCARSSNVSIRPRFPRSTHCMKNLAYALIKLGRVAEAEEVVTAAITGGLPKVEFQHLNWQLRGKPHRPGHSGKARGGRTGSSVTSES